jgi:hypothetical protein
MMVPDAARIAAVLLFTAGFSHADALAERVTQLFALCAGGAGAGGAAGAAPPAPLSRAPH